MLLIHGEVRGAESMAITLWGAGTSRTVRPIWMAEELGVEYELHPIGPRTGETRTKAFTELNPKQKIPVMVDGDLRLTESVAISRYLRDRYANTAAIASPVTLEDRAREDAWCCYVFGEIDETSLYVMRRHRDLSSIYGEAPAAVTSSAEYAGKHLRVVAEHLARNKYLLPAGFGLADLILMTCLDWAHAYGVGLPDPLSDWRLKVAARPAYQRAMKANRRPI